MSLIPIKHVVIRKNAKMHGYSGSSLYRGGKLVSSPVFIEYNTIYSEIKLRMEIPPVENINGKDYVQIEYNIYYLLSDCTEVVEMIEAIPPKKINEKAKLVVGAVFSTPKDQDTVFYDNKSCYSVALSKGILPEGTYTIKEIDRSARSLEGENPYRGERSRPTPTRATIESRDGKLFRISLTDTKQFTVISYPTTYSYSIVDANGAFYAGPKPDVYHGRQYYCSNQPNFDTYGKAKKFKDLSKLKASVMYFIGYTSFTESMEIDSMVSSDKLFDFDPTWRAVKVDKLTNTIVETIDIMPWLNGLLRLKPITEKFGSSVRAARKDFENGKYEFPFVAVKKFDLDQNDEPIKVKGTSLVDKKVTPCKIYSTSDSVAIACSKSSATKIKLANDGVSIIDLDGLSEFIEE